MKQTKSINFFGHLAMILLTVSVVACNGETGSNNNTNAGNNNNTANNAANNGGDVPPANEPSALCGDFEGTLADSDNVTYRCIDAAGGISEIYFNGNGGVEVNNTDVGTYELVDDQIHLVLPNISFDRTSVEAEVQLGMLARFVFEDDNGNELVSCGAVDHQYDLDAEIARYDCPTINVIPNGDYWEDPIFDFAPVNDQVNSPNFGQPQFGFAFWSTQIRDNTNRDYYGIYRQSGDTLCAYFPHAPGDSQNVTLELINGGQEVRVDRDEYDTGDCGRE